MMNYLSSTSFSHVKEEFSSCKDAGCPQEQHGFSHAQDHHCANTTICSQGQLSAGSRQGPLVEIQAMILTEHLVVLCKPNFYSISITRDAEECSAEAHSSLSTWLISYEAGLVPPCFISSRNTLCSPGIPHPMAHTVLHECSASLRSSTTEHCTETLSMAHIWPAEFIHSRWACPGLSCSGVGGAGGTQQWQQYLKYFSFFYFLVKCLKELITRSSHLIVRKVKLKSARKQLV